MATRHKAESVAQELGTSLLVGTACVQFRGASEHRFNSALWLDESGQLQGRYDKMHPVMFGECCEGPVQHRNTADGTVLLRKCRHTACCAAAFSGCKDHNRCLHFVDTPLLS